MVGDDYDGNDFYCDVAIPNSAQLDVVYEDGDILAYKHTRPYWKIHYVVTTKSHVDSLLTLNDYMLGASLLRVVTDLAREVDEKFGACSVVTNLGDYQDSKHIHFHVRFGERTKRES